VNLQTERLTLIPYTLLLCQQIVDNDFSGIQELNLQKGISWPDEDVLESLPRILINLQKVEAPTGFESWMIVKKETREIIGDIGFKGLQEDSKEIDLGYGIIKEERLKGYTFEAASTLISWAFSSNHINHITASCNLNNVSSIKLLTKLNFKLLKEEKEMAIWTLPK
jgi:ribosomal-protein-alanine N-acetyltransferase